MSSASLPSENLDPIAMADISAFGAASAAQTLPELIPATMVMLSSDEVENRVAQEVQISSVLPAKSENPAEAQAVAAEFAIERDASETSTREPKLNLQANLQPAPLAAAAAETAGTDVLAYFNLPQQPFDVTPDPAYLYGSASHREALASLKDGIEHFRGFAVLVAEPGMGKTTLLHKLMNELADSARVVFLFQTQCSSLELLRFILNELEVDHSGMDVVAMHRALNQALLEEMLRGRRFVLIVDEAQNLQEPVLETIRLLSDFETTHSKLIQIVLAGQPQLAEVLTRPSLVQLRQRIAVLSSLKALTATETAEYIEHRLRAAGWRDSLLFSSEALDQIAESSQGVPRSINHLCFNSLLEAFHRGHEFVEAGIVREVAAKLDIESLMRPTQAKESALQPAGQAPAISTSELARALASALTQQSHAGVNSANRIAPQQKPEVILTGNLTEKVRSQGWSKRHEYRIMVTLERDQISGLPVADRYYCCSIYMDEPQAAGLEPGKPVRIKIEQD
jgi:type II secretory pathway predicted ATPase ExeA